MSSRPEPPRCFLFRVALATLLSFIFTASLFAQTGRASGAGSEGLHVVVFTGRLDKPPDFLPVYFSTDFPQILSGYLLENSIPEQIQLGGLVIRNISVRDIHTFPLEAQAHAAAHRNGIQDDEYKLEVVPSSPGGSLVVRLSGAFNFMGLTTNSSFFLKPSGGALLSPASNNEESLLIAVTLLSEIPLIANAPYRVETKETTHPTLVQQSVPQYPPEFQNRQPHLRSQEITLKAIVRSDGTIDPSNVLIVSTPHASFARSAFEALKTWKFQPGERQGNPVDVLSTFEFSFTLR